MTYKSYNPFSLLGKRIMITGASSGIGKSTAIECSKMGAELVITARNEERLANTYQILDGGNHIQIICDLTNSVDVGSLVEKIPELNGIVICAGINETLPLQFANRKKIESIFETNFYANTELLRLLLKKKKLMKESSIVSIASIGGIFSIDYGNGIYGASKAALVSWMKTLAKELAPKRIRVNSICPGMVETPLGTPSAFTEDQLKEDEKRYPLGRYGNPEEIAYACVYFLSDASKWVTGTTFIIDGGVTI